MGNGNFGTGNGNNTTGNTSDNGGNAVELMGQQIVSKQVDEDTRGIRGFKLADGTQINYDQAITAISNGDSKGLMVQNGRFGLQIRTSPDMNYDNNLGALPVDND